MKWDFVKKYVAYIIVSMMFSVIPALVNAQKKCPDGICPKGFFCSDGQCVKFVKGPVCPHCPWNTIYKYGSKSASISFSLDKPGKVSVKIFDLTGRFIRTLADNSFGQGVYELQWDATEI